MPYFVLGQMRALVLHFCCCFVWKREDAIYSRTIQRSNGRNIEYMEKMRTPHPSSHSRILFAYDCIANNQPKNPHYSNRCKIANALATIKCMWPCATFYTLFLALSLLSVSFTCFFFLFTDAIKMRFVYDMIAVEIYLIIFCSITLCMNFWPNYGVYVCIFCRIYHHQNRPSM